MRGTNIQKSANNELNFMILDRNHLKSNYLFGRIICVSDRNIGLVRLGKGGKKNLGDVGSFCLEA